MPERLTISVTEAAKLLGCGRDKAYELAKAGKIPAIIEGKFIRVPREALLRYLRGEESVDIEAAANRILRESLETRLAELDAMREVVLAKLRDVSEEIIPQGRAAA